MSLTLEYFYQKTNQNYNLNLLTDSVSLNKKITWVYLLDDVNKVVSQISERFSKEERGNAN